MIAVREIRVDPDTGEVALYAPSGHPIDPTPWLLIQPGRTGSEDEQGVTVTVGVSTGHDWCSSAHVALWERLDVSDFLPPVRRLSDLLEAHRG